MRRVGTEPTIQRFCQAALFCQAYLFLCEIRRFLPVSRAYLKRGFLPPLALLTTLDDRRVWNVYFNAG
jgi:hypothetical protein